MALFPETFTTRKRRPGASFNTSKLSDLNLLFSLLQLTDQICSINLNSAANFLFNRASCSAIRKTQLLGVVFEDLIRSSNANPNSVVFPPLSSSASKKCTSFYTKSKR
ncbi:hypothetical protein ACSQ67_020998 [Phaseolus vulgaris]